MTFTLSISTWLLPLKMPNTRPQNSTYFNIHPLMTRNFLTWLAELFIRRASFCRCLAALTAFFRSFSISCLRSLALFRCSALLASSMLSATDSAVLKRRPRSVSVEGGYLRPNGEMVSNCEARSRITYKLQAVYNLSLDFQGL